MSTYTDLHNQIKETLVVGYRPDDRMTTQKVKFVNKENEYWGTFKGSIVAEDPTFNGGTFNGVEINDSTLKGVTMETSDGHKIDIDTVANDIQGMQQDIESLEAADKQLDTKIDQTKADLDARIDGVIAGAKETDERVTKIEGDIVAINDDIAFVSASLSTEVSDRIQADKDLSADIMDVMSDTSVSLNNHAQDLVDDEKFARILADGSLDNKIDAETEARTLADETLSNTLSTAFEIGKHYDLNVVDTTERPYKAKEFAVNIIKTQTSDATVYDIDGKAVIGRLDGAATGTINFVVNTNVPDKYKTALVPGQTYTFEGSTTAVYTVNGYQMILERGETLDATKFTLKPAVDSYYPLIWDKSDTESLQNIGLITSGLEEAATGFLVSGYVTIDTSDTTLTAFNCSYEDFNKNDKKEISVSNNVIKYVGSNAFSLEKNLQIKNYMQLLNTLSDDEMFGKVYEYDVMKDDTGKLTSIQIKLLDLPSKLTLDGSNSFKTEVSSDVSSTTYISMTDAEEVLVKKEAVKYQYDFYVPPTAGADAAVDYTSYGKVIVDAWNTYLSDDFDDTLTIDLTDEEHIPALKKIYTLDKDESGKWTTTRVLEENQISITIDKELKTIDIRIVTAETHATVTKLFVIDGDSAEVMDDQSVELAKTAPLTYVYPESESTPEAIYKAVVGKRVDTVGPTFYFGCSTAGADEVTIMVPNKPVTKISREMVFVVYVTSALEDVKLHFVDEDGNDIRSYYKRSLEFKIPTNAYSTIMLREVYQDIFLLFDLNENSQDSKIEKLRQELEAFEGRVEWLSDEISADVEKLSDDLSIEISSQISSLSTALSADIGALSDGISADVNQLSTWLSTDISALSDWLSADIDALSTSLSLELSSQISSLSTSLSNTIDAICVMLSDDTKDVSVDVEWLSAQLSAVIDRDAKDVTYCKNLVYVPGHPELTGFFLHQPFCEEMPSYEFKYGNMYHLSAAQPELIDKDGVKYSFNANDMIIFNKDVILKNATFADFEIIKNYDVACEQFAAKDKALSDAIDKLSDDLSIEISSQISSLSTALSIDIDTLTAWLSADVDALSTSLSLELSNQILSLSTDLSTQISALSDGISTDVNRLSTWLSTDISALSNGISADVNQLSTWLSTDISALSDWLSADIKALSTSLSLELSSQISSLSTSLSTDISTLSNWLSTDIKSLSTALSTEINLLCDHLSDDVKLSVSNLVGYNAARVEDIAFVSNDLSTLEHQHYNLTLSAIDRSIDDHISSDNLIVTAGVHEHLKPHQRYYLTFNYGTLVLSTLD